MKKRKLYQNILATIIWTNTIYQDEDDMILKIRFSFIED